MWVSNVGIKFQSRTTTLAGRALFTERIKAHYSKILKIILYYINGLGSCTSLTYYGLINYKYEKKNSSKKTKIITQTTKHCCHYRHYDEIIQSMTEH